MIFAGIDVGSQSTACVLWDGRKVLGFSVLPSGVNPKKRAHEVLTKALEMAGRTDAPLRIAATGYGRYQVDGAQVVVSEITCQAKGVAYFFPKAKTVIDIGGQDSKVIRLGEGGRVLDFVMNDKCAAGTGRFLELMAQVLEIRLEDYGILFAKAKERLTLSHICAVFAESELIGYIAQGKKKEDLVWAVADAVAERVTALGERIGIVPPLVVTGGVAKNKAVLTLLEERLRHPILVPEEPLMTAALGACLLAREQA
ncbi:MAG: acyl-CoA dehydratase activase [Candidatus Caldatribacterium sp.]|uniref:acyl-CoA dehydratase activase n=1 Tax=Candidatus Caldatribacterium sp. TaxID=2282143 RepID=UPI0029971804|nr:acyl-CoA dehydratase activase [Candidatus Caldatribacterium sp.]MCX7730457.1 acyl-CoA dehydratase activase [Candidatus Caldatribacterium sp.]MDW8081065.1 acyl-CoA dehydratase activase [Candidatus Calescibacterium sp.]